MALFRDRADAAHRLIAEMPDEVGPGWLVLALPRGGVPVAAPIATHLGAALDLMLVRKVGAPFNPELAVAAVTGPGPDEIVENGPLCRALGLGRATLERLAAPRRAEIAERRRLWLGDRPSPDLSGRNVLLVDDGVATGTTLGAAIAAARRAGARRVGVAVPVALGDSLAQQAGQADLIVCPAPSAPLHAVGAAYDRFGQVDDREVARLLAAAGAGTATSQRRA